VFWSPPPLPGFAFAAMSRQWVEGEG